ncbi:MAG: hypothetical protein ACJ8F7_20340 [Gemmataceae bacterium]
MVRRAGGGREHAPPEVEQFAAVACADGVEFVAITYQEVLLCLARQQCNGHRAYVDYLAECYL